MRDDDCREADAERTSTDPVSDTLPGQDEVTDAKQGGLPTSMGRRSFFVLAGAAITTPFVASRSAAAESGTHKLVVVTTEDPSELSFGFTTTGEIAKLFDEGDDSAEEVNDHVTRNDNGTWTATGYTGNGYGDAFAFEGEILDFWWSGDAFEVYVDGQEVSPDTLVGDGPDHRIEILTTEDPSELSYEFTTTGPAEKVVDGSRNGAERNLDDIEANGDGTWTVSGYTGNGYGDTFDFDGEVVDFTPRTGPFDVRIDGDVVDLDGLLTREPADEGTDDSEEETDENSADEGRDHELIVRTTEDPSELSFEFTTTGEAEKLFDRGDDSAEQNLDDIEANGDGTWTVSGYTGNGYGDAFAFDGEVTDFSPTVGPFELELDGETVSVYELTGTEPPEEVVGGGAGYSNVVAEDEATVVVSSFRGLRNALGSASAGDVVYVAGDATIGVGSNQLTIPAGVTLASDRGIDGSAGGLIRTGSELWPMFEVRRNARVTGVRIDGPNHEYEAYNRPISIGLDVTGRGVEIDNCELSGFSHAAVRAGRNTHVHHSHIHHNPMDGLGYGVLCTGGRPLIEYNVMDYNRHGVASNGSGGYTVRYNHFGPNTIGHVIDCHRPGGTAMEIHHNTIEANTRVHESGQVPAVAIRGVPDDGARIEQNWFHNPDRPRNAPDGWTDEAIIQVHTSQWRNVSFDGNAYGSEDPGPDVGCP